MSIKQRNILILSLSGIGNFLMQSPVFSRLKQELPNARITLWVAPRNTYSLAKSNPHIDKVIQAPIKQSLFRHGKHLLALRRNNFDTGIVLYPGQLWKSAAYIFLAGIPRRIGHRYSHLGNPDSSLFLNSPVAIRSSLHDLEQNLNLLTPLGISLALKTASISIPPGLPAGYNLTLPGAHHKKAGLLLRRMRIPAGKTLIGLHPGSASHFKWKRWPLENFADLGRQLAQKHNAHLLIFGGPAEAKLKKQLRSLIGKSHCSIISKQLLTSAAVINKCNLFISNDTGLMHIAAAQDVKTLGLFGPTNEHRTGPRGANSSVIRAPGTKPDYDVTYNFDLGPDPHSSLLKLSPGQVLKAAANILPPPD